MTKPDAQRQSFSRAVFQLMKLRVTWAVSLSAATGYLLAAHRFDLRFLLPVGGTFLLAAGASALNQWQEAHIDAKMPRTRNRPLPSGQISSSTALFVAGLLILLGLYVLASVPEQTGLVLGLGILAVAWYNGVYTYLKRVTAFAVVPGSLIGALPPLIGYTAGGGAIDDPLILLVASLFFICQIPHFWLLLLVWGEQYAMAGLPTLTRLLSRRQLVRVSFMWMLATAAAGLTIPALSKGAVALPWSVVLVVASVWLFFQALDLLRQPPEHERPRHYRRAFLRINAYMLAVMITLMLNGLTTGP